PGARGAAGATLADPAVTRVDLVALRVIQITGRAHVSLDSTETTPGVRSANATSAATLFGVSTVPARTTLPAATVTCTCAGSTQRRRSRPASRISSAISLSVRAKARTWFVRV